MTGAGGRAALPFLQVEPLHTGTFVPSSKLPACQLGACPLVTRVAQPSWEVRAQSLITIFPGGRVPGSDLLKGQIRVCLKALELWKVALDAGVTLPAFRFESLVCRGSTM